MDADDLNLQHTRHCYIDVEDELDRVGPSSWPRYCSVLGHAHDRTKNAGPQESHRTTRVNVRHPQLHAVIRTVPRGCFLPRFSLLPRVGLLPRARLLPSAGL